MAEPAQSGSQECPSVSFQGVATCGISKLPNKDLSVKITGTITPGSKADKISFSSTMTARATVTELGRTAQGNSVVVELKITGVSPTPPTKPQGDANVEAVCTMGKKTKTVAKTPILVVVPASQTHAVGQKLMINDGQVFADRTGLQTMVSCTVTITIKDQFGVVLNSIYDGAGVVQEKFTPIKVFGGMTPPGPGWVTINTGNLSGGAIADICEIGPQRIGVPRLFTPAQLNAWKAGTYQVPELNNADNTYQTIIPVGFIATQEIRVHGWDVGPSYKRTQKTNQQPYGPGAYDFSDQ